MDTTVIALVTVVVLLVLALAAGGVLLARRRRSERLQQHYGPEYERIVNDAGDQRAAESKLVERERRHRKLHLRDLGRDERERFTSSWAGIQGGFVDDPVQAVREADDLVVDIMRTRGYGVDDFERQAEDVSVEHPEVVGHYRRARAVRDAAESGSVDTEQQRAAVTSYRVLVNALLEPGPNRHDSSRHRDESRRDNSAPAKEEIR